MLVCIRGIAPCISKELQEPTKAKIVKKALIWVAKHKEMQRNKGHAIYSDCLAEREKVRSRSIGFRFVVKLQTGKENSLCLSDL
jgi:hypothetical protein